jgi:8-oxo-dGTP diphosphatase
MIHTTLVFLRQENEILLAMKKRRFGAGKWNGAGGKVEPGETYEQAAIRECQEEIGVTPIALEKVGELHFFDLPDVEHYTHVYTTGTWKGEPYETEEMAPRWFAESEVPYDTMWPDDIYWIPMMLTGKRFKGTVTVEGDVLRQHDIYEVNDL